MSFASTTQSTVLDNIYTGVTSSLAAVPAITGVTSYYAPPASYAGDAIVWIGIDKGGRIGGQAPAAIGQGGREESYLIRGKIVVTQTTDNDTVAQAARTRAYTILARIEDYLRKNPTTATAGVRLAEAENVVLAQTFTAGTNRTATISFDVRVHARI